VSLACDLCFFVPASAAEAAGTTGTTLTLTSLSSYVVLRAKKRERERTKREIINFLNRKEFELHYQMISLRLNLQIYALIPSDEEDGDATNNSSSSSSFPSSSPLSFKEDEKGGVISTR